VKRTAPRVATNERLLCGRLRVGVFLAPALIVAAVLLLHAGSSSADASSWLSDSTVMGQNRGFPSGTPSQGHTAVGAVDLVTEVSIFLQNIEKLKDVPGRTLVGFILPLRFRYRAHEQVTFELGAVLGHDFGDDNKLNAAAPLVRLTWEPVESLSLIGGTIIPTHWMNDALLDDVNKLEGVEQGFQLRSDRDLLGLETWVNWRVNETALRPEEFEVGFASQLRPCAGTRLDGQALWSHAGGQQNTSNRVEHNLTLLVGGSYGFAEPLGLGRVDEVRFGGRYLRSWDGGRNLPSESGDGWEIFAQVDTNPFRESTLRVYGSYFQGTGFHADRGDPLYTLDDYAQLGFKWIVPVAKDFRFEGGVALQLGESQFNGSFLLGFAWGQAFGVVTKPGEKSGAIRNQ